jgi:hypothetical protein
VLDGTPKHKTRRNQGATHAHIYKSWKAAALWDEECNRLIKRRKAAQLKLKEVPARENFVSYKKKEAKAKSGLRKIKKEYFKKFCYSINQYTGQSYIWEKISKLTNTWNCGMQPNECKEEKIITVEQRIQNLRPPWIETEPPALDNTNGDPFLDTPLDIEELNSAIDSVKVESSPGLDSINYKVIKYLPEEMRKLLLTLYNEILQTGGFSNEWKQYAIFFIPKEDGKNFRPISLAPCLLKILERIINGRLSWWLEHHKKPPDLQFGFLRE